MGGEEGSGTRRGPSGPVQRALSLAGDARPGQARTSPHPPGHRGPRRPPGRAEGTRTAAEARSPPAERQLPRVPAPRERRLGRSGADGEAPRPTRAHHGPCTPAAVPARPPPRLDGARAAIGAALWPARLPWRRAFVWPRRGRSAREQRPRPRRGEGEGGESGVEEREGGGGGGGRGGEGREGGGREEKEGGAGRSPRRWVFSAGFEPRFAADSVRPWAGHHPGTAPSAPAPATSRFGRHRTPGPPPHIGFRPATFPAVPAGQDGCALTSSQEPQPPQPLRIRGAPAHSERAFGDPPSAPAPGASVPGWAPSVGPAVP